MATISCKIKFIDSAGFLASSLSNPVDNFAEGIHKIKCKDYDYFLEYQSVKINFYFEAKIIQTSMMKN